MLPLISIIVPVYNVEKFLDKCIISILNQSYNNIEIILINDGSLDNSLAICEKYKKIDKRVKLFNKKNEGVSSARNFGLVKSTGEFILFVDGDDYINENCINILYKSLIENHCDISCANIISENLNGEEINLLKTNDKKHIFSINDYSMYNRSVYNKLFRRNCLLSSKKQVFFDESIHYGEDALFVVQAFIRAKKIIFTPEKTYHYVIHQSSAMHNFSYKSLSELTAWNRIIDCLIPYPKALKEAKAQLSINSQRILINLYRNDNFNLTNKKLLLDNLRKYKMDVYSSKYISIKNKLYYLIFSLNPKLYIKSIDLMKNYFSKGKI